MPSWTDDDGRCHFEVNGIPCYESAMGCPAHRLRKPRRSKVAKAKKLEPRFRAYDVVCRAVEEGVATGLRRAYKHSNSEPSTVELARMQDAIERAVNAALCEVLDLTEED